MRNQHSILAVALLATALSCVHKETGPERVTFKAIMADDPATRTVLQSDGSVFWSPRDSINLFYGTSFAMLTADNTAASAQASFTGELDGFLPNGQDEFWAVYPYSSANRFDGSAVTLTLPSQQNGVAGTFDAELFVSLARSKDYTLQFYNLCGGVKFSVAQTGIQYVTFRGNANETLAGQVTVAFDTDGKPQVQDVLKGATELRLNAPEGGFEVGKWYYIVALPVTLSAGYTMTFFKDADGTGAVERAVDTPVTIKRSTWGRLTDADNVGPKETSYIYYTSTDGTVVSPNEGAFFGEGVTLVSNTYENGQGVMQFDGLVTTIGENALRFYSSSGSASLKTIILPETCVSIGEFAFGSQAYLEEVQLPESLRVINYGAFAVCVNLSGIVFPDNLEEIYHNAFSNCWKLTEVTIPQNVQVLESGAFSNCTGMKHFYGKFAADSGRALIDGETLLAVAVLDLDSYTVPDGVKAIGNYAILGYPSLSEILLPDGLLSIGARAISNTNVRNLIIPKSVVYFGEGALCNNTILESITIKAVMPPTGGTSMFDETNNCPIYVPEQSVAVYKKAEYWSAYAERIQPTEGESPITASKYLTFTSEETTKISLTNNAGNAPVLYYSTDAENWILWDYSELTFTANAPLYICGDNPQGLSTSNKYSRFISTGDLFAVSGDIMSLLNRNEDLLTIPREGCFRSLFDSNECLTVAPSLPATELANGCYRWMFYKCTSLITAPELPATSLEPNCYVGMFGQCKKLTRTPELPATVLAGNCYSAMFKGCTSLQEVLPLPALTMERTCYALMFSDCTSLTSAPALPATTLAESCYQSMFSGCTALTEAPVLPATILDRYCYTDMFGNCSSIAYVKCLASDLSAENCTLNWLTGVATTGTFVKAANVEWPTGASGIPEGWAVEEL